MPSDGERASVGFGLCVSTIFSFQSVILRTCKMIMGFLRISLCWIFKHVVWILNFPTFGNNKL